MIKSLVRICILLVVVFAVAWPFLPEQRQRFFMSVVTGDVDWQALVLTNPFTDKTIVKADPIMREVTNLIASNELGKEFLSSVHAPQQYHCEPVKTHAITDKKTTSLYRWKDDKGRWHFGDQQRDAPEQAVDISQQYQSKYQYFKLLMMGDVKLLPAFATDKIRAETKQIFSVLSDSLSIDYLRQVELNLRLIASQNDFQQHRNRVAPSLKTNTGFYSTQNNEAVIWQGKSPELMHAVIRHESTHVIMAGLYGYPPVWLNEGMAEYFEQLQVSANSKMIAVNPYWLGLLRKQAEPLPRYLSLSAEQWRSGDQKMMYAMGWGLVHFLMSERERKQFLSLILAHLAKHKCHPFSTINFVNKHYPQGVNGLQRDWTQWLGSDIARHYY